LNDAIYLLRHPGIVTKLAKLSGGCTWSFFPPVAPFHINPGKLSARGFGGVLIAATLNNMKPVVIRIQPIALRLGLAELLDSGARELAVDAGRGFVPFCMCSSTDTNNFSAVKSALPQPGFF
jgi:hypothetical protein